MTDPKTTITALATLIVFLAATFGFHVPVEVQGSIIVIGMAIMGHFSQDAKKPDK